jgi:hypothetical protein
MIVDLMDGPSNFSWTGVLFDLKRNSPNELYNDQFYQWLEETWKIKAIQEIRIESQPILVGLEMPDEVYTMLILKYS